MSYRTKQFPILLPLSCFDIVELGYKACDPKDIQILFFALFLYFFVLILPTWMSIVRAGSINPLLKTYITFCFFNFISLAVESRRHLPFDVFDVSVLLGAF